MGMVGKKTVQITGIVLGVCVLLIGGYFAYLRFRTKQAQINIHGYEGYLIDDFEDLDYSVIPDPNKGGYYFQSPKGMGQWEPFVHTAAYLQQSQNFEKNKSGNGLLGAISTVKSNAQSLEGLDPRFEEVRDIAIKRGYIELGE